MTQLTITKTALPDIMDRFREVGALRMGGVTRLGYTTDESRMHDIFRNFADELGFRTWTDRYGNSFAANFDEDSDFFLVGSHLDSVVEGGRFDGVAGVVSGLMAMAELRNAGIEFPMMTAAFRCEESSNFGRSLVGSSLLTGKFHEDPNDVISRSGEKLSDKLENFKDNPTLDISRIKAYLELHIEQGRVLENAENNVGVVTAIAAAHRHKISIFGTAEHSGATPMELRRDGLCTAAEIILAVERFGKSEAVVHSVAAISVIDNHPNVINVVPGLVELRADLRGTNIKSLERMDELLATVVDRISRKRNIRTEITTLEKKTPVPLDYKMGDRLWKAALDEGLSCTRMPSGAGHDAMNFAGICPAGMLFIPCRDGISHNPGEYTERSQIEDGIRVMVHYLTELAGSDK